MSGLSDAEREALLSGVVIMGARGFIHNPRCGQVAGNNYLRKPREGDRLAGCCHRLHAVIEPDSVEDIVRAAITKVLNEAADAIEAEHLTDATGRSEDIAYDLAIDHAAAVVRAATPKPPEVVRRP